MGVGQLVFPLASYYTSIIILHDSVRTIIFIQVQGTLTRYIELINNSSNIIIMAMLLLVYL